MVRLADLSDAMRATVTRIHADPVDPPAWVQPPERSARKVTLISSAGLGLKSEPLFRGGDGGYRQLPHSAPAADIIMSHISVNYDRTGFQLDLESILPRARLEDLVAEGLCGSAADTHYSFMGASSPEQLEAEAKALAGKLAADGVNCAVLLPV